MCPSVPLSPCPCERYLISMLHLSRAILIDQCHQLCHQGPDGLLAIVVICAISPTFHREGTTEPKKTNCPHPLSGIPHSQCTLHPCPVRPCPMHTALAYLSLLLPQWLLYARQWLGALQEPAKNRSISSLVIVWSPVMSIILKSTCRANWAAGGAAVVSLHEDGARS